MEIAPLRRIARGIARGSSKVRHADCNQVALEAYLSFSQCKVRVYVRDTKIQTSSRIVHSSDDLACFTRYEEVLPRCTWLCRKMPS